MNDEFRELPAFLKALVTISFVMTAANAVAMVAFSFWLYIVFAQFIMAR